MLLSVTLHGALKCKTPRALSLQHPISPCSCAFPSLRLDGYLGSSLVASYVTRSCKTTSTSTPQAASNMITSSESSLNFLFEYCGSGGADTVLRSHDSHHFRVPKTYIIDSSPVLKELILKTRDIPNSASGESPHSVVQLPESGAILHSLLTFIFPVTSIVPSTAENAMELLSVAQKYQMDSVLAHIRDRIARQDPQSNKLDSAVHVFSRAKVRTPRGSTSGSSNYIEIPDGYRRFGG